MREELLYVAFKMTFALLCAGTVLAGYMLYRLFKLNKEH